MLRSYYTSCYSNDFHATVQEQLAAFYLTHCALIRSFTFKVAEQELGITITFWSAGVHDPCLFRSKNLVSRPLPQKLYHMMTLRTFTWPLYAT